MNMKYICYVMPPNSERYIQAGINLYVKDDITWVKIS